MLKKIAMFFMIIGSLTGCATHAPFGMPEVAQRGRDFKTYAEPAIQDVMDTNICPPGYTQVDKRVTGGSTADVRDQNRRIDYSFGAGGTRSVDCVKTGSKAVEKAAPAPATTKQPTKKIPLSVLDNRNNYAVGWAGSSAVPASNAWQPNREVKPAWKSPRQKWEEKEAKRKQAQYSRVPTKRVGHKGYVESDIPGLAPAVMAWRMENFDIPPCNSSNGGTVATNVSSKETKSGFQRERLDFQVKCKP